MLSHDELVNLFPLKYLKETDENGQLKYTFNPGDGVFKMTLQKVLEEVFKDFNFRTLSKNKDIEAVLKEKIEEYGGTTKFFAEKLMSTDTEYGNYFNLVKEYLTGECSESFDDFHHNLCNCFLAAIKQYNEKDIYTNLQYGKAQKIVNMMFKHLYCLEGAEKKEHLFADCHMALDSFTLEWFCRCYQQYKNSVSYGKIIKGKIPEWSNLEYSQSESDFVCRDEKEYYSYNYFVKTIREILNGAYPNGKENPYKGEAPFKAEFRIWPDIQLTMATEAYILALPDRMYEDAKYSNMTDKEIEYLRKKELAEKDLKSLIDKARELSATFITNT